MYLNKQQQINLVIALEQIGIKYSINRDEEGYTTLVINGKAQSIASLKCIFESKNALSMLNISATNLTREIRVMMLDTFWYVVCEFDIDNTGGITIQRMTLKDELFPIDWSNKIYAAVLCELQKELEKEGL